MVATSLAAASLTGCGGGAPERSAAAFCQTMRSEKERILAQLEETSAAGAASGDEFLAALSGLGASIQALGELRTYFQKLAKVAPEDIRTEIEIVAESYDQQVDDAGDGVTKPLETAVGALFEGLATSGQVSAVDEYARANCGEGI